MDSFRCQKEPERTLLPCPHVVTTTAFQHLCTLRVTVSGGPHGRAEEMRSASRLSSSGSFLLRVGTTGAVTHVALTCSRKVPSVSHPVSLNGLAETHPHRDSNLGRSRFPRNANSGSRDALLGLSFLDQITSWLPRGLQMTNPKGGLFGLEGKQIKYARCLYFQQLKHAHTHRRAHTHTHHRECTVFTYSPVLSGA